MNKRMLMFGLSLLCGASVVGMNHKPLVVERNSKKTGLYDCLPIEDGAVDASSAHVLTAALKKSSRKRKKVRFADEPSHQPAPTLATDTAACQIARASAVSMARAMAANKSWLVPALCMCGIGVVGAAMPAGCTETMKGLSACVQAIEFSDLMCMPRFDFIHDVTDAALDACVQAHTEYYSTCYRDLEMSGALLCALGCEGVTYESVFEIDQLRRESASRGAQIKVNKEHIELLAEFKKYTGLSMGDEKKVKVLEHLIDRDSKLRKKININFKSKAQELNNLLKNCTDK